MPPVDLERQFQSLPTSVSADDHLNRLAASPIPQYENHRVARTVDGAPTLLLASRDSTYRSYSAPILLEHLTVQYELACRIIRPDGSEEQGVFTVISCVNSDLSLQSHFLRVSSLVVKAVGTNPSRLEISRTVEGLIELFRALTQPPRKSVQGLWAELFLIGRSNNPELLASAWHVLPEDRFDFSNGNQRVEVKGASGRIRQHYFSLEQLREVAGVTVLIASLFVERAGGGLTLGRLLNEVRVLLAGEPQLALRVESVVAMTLGESLRRGLEDAFDAELAETSLRFYRTSDVPAITTPIPTQVSEVRFKSDLASVSPFVVSRELTSLFRGLLRT